MDPNDNFFSLSFSASPVALWLEKKPYWCFLIFSIFLLFFWNSLFRVGLEWIRTIILFFSHSRPFPSRFGFKRSHIDVFEFFCYLFLEFYIPGRLGIDRNNNFFSSLSLNMSRPGLAWKEAIIIFFNFLNYFEFFWEFYIPDRVGTDQNENFFFSLFLDHSLPVLAWKEAITMFFNFFHFFVVFFLIPNSGSGWNESER